MATSIFVKRVYARRPLTRHEREVFKAEPAYLRPKNMSESCAAVVFNDATWEANGSLDALDDTTITGAAGTIPAAKREALRACGRFLREKLAKRRY